MTQPSYSAIAVTVDRAAKFLACRGYESSRADDEKHDGHWWLRAARRCMSSDNRYQEMIDLLIALETGRYIDGSPLIDQDASLWQRVETLDVLKHYTRAQRLYVLADIDAALAKGQTP